MVEEKHKRFAAGLLVLFVTCILSVIGSSSWLGIAVEIAELIGLVLLAQICGKRKLKWAVGCQAVSAVLAGGTLLLRPQSGVILAVLPGITGLVSMCFSYIGVAEYVMEETRAELMASARLGVKVLIVSYAVSLLLVVADHFKESYLALGAGVLLSYVSVIATLLALFLRLSFLWKCRKQLLTCCRGAGN